MVACTAECVRTPVTFHVRTDDPQYTPIWKLELFKRTYKRKVGPFAFFYRLLGLKRRLRSKTSRNGNT